MNSTVPVAVSGGLTFQSVSAGREHSCGVTTTGTAYCWGAGYPGKLGDGSGSDAVVPVAVAGGLAFQSLTTGTYHTCGVALAGTAHCWGQGFSGQLGNGANGNELMPAIVSGGMTFQDLDAGGAFNCGTTSTGEAHCWGLNNFGQLGNGTTSNRNTPVAVVDPVPTPDPGHTPPGSDVAVTPTDETTGDPAPTTITFDEVTGSGETTVTSGSVGGGGGPPAPDGANFRLGQPPTYYDITTTATFTGSVEICVDYSGSSYGNESQLKLLHYDESTGAWEDVTTSLDTSTTTVCGVTGSLSPFQVAEENAAPVVTGIALPADPVPVGTAVSVSATFTDANPADVHIATIDWRAGTTAGTITESDGSGSVAGTFTFTEAGVHTIAVTVSDGGLSGTRSSSADEPAYVVVYDPSGSFVTGGGWIDSPVGACTLPTCDDDTTGKAAFGFVSRYKKGARTPSGNTEFQFKAGALNFKSSAHDWLVVAGARAQFKGTGTINGSGDYGFLLTAIDGDLNGGGGLDRFRIKIVDRTSRDVVYDNQRGSDETSDATTELGGGNIRIHK